jgi:hypothetical protein
MLTDQGSTDQSKKYKLIVNGQPVEVTEPEVIALAQQGKFFTQNEQKLRAREKELDAETEKKAQSMFDAWLKEIAESNGTDGQSQVKTDSHSEQDPVNPAIANELKTLRKQLEELGKNQQRQSAESLKREMDGLMQGLKSKYPNMNRRDLEDRFLKEATDKDNPAELFEKFAKESHEQTAKDRQQIIDDYVKSKSNPPADSGEIGGSGGVDSTIKVEAPKDLEEASTRAKEFIEASRGNAPMI